MTIQEDLTELKKDLNHFKSNDFKHLEERVDQGFAEIKAKINRPAVGYIGTLTAILTLVGVILNLIG